MNFEGIYCFDTATVRFALYPNGPGGQRVLGEISEDALHDGFGVREAGPQLLDACRERFDTIASMALARYRTDPRCLIVLTTEDFTH